MSLKSRISHISCVLPKERLTNDVLAQRFGDSVMAKIENMTGIHARRISAKGECASDLAVKAANSLFESGACNKDEIGLLIFGTQTPDYTMPTTACIIQDRLGLSTSCAAFDVNLGCSQYPYILALARSWIASGLCKKALVLTADTPSKLINFMDKSAVTLFSDAASASILEASDTDCIEDFDFGSDGSGFSDLIVPASGFRNPPTPDDHIVREDENHNFRANVNMHIDGFKIFTFAYRVVPESVKRLLAKNNLTVDDIDMFIFHQAGEMMVSSVAKKLGIASEKVHRCMSEFGNCGGSSVPIALANAILAGRVKAGMRIVLSAFGVGLSWGSVLMTCPDISAIIDA